MPKRHEPARKRSSKGSAKGGSAKPAKKAKEAAKPPAKGPSPKPAPKKPPAKPAPAKSTPVKPAPTAKAPAKGAVGAAANPEAGKVARKGITIVSPKPARRPPKSGGVKLPTLGAPLIRPGGPARKPLIESGPNAPSRFNAMGANGGKPRKSPFDKRELTKFRTILLRKRAELVGDVRGMENEALMGSSGSLSHLPQHMAEQGSDAYGQSLSLDLAAADRRLIKEIDDALKRIEDGTYGICELTGKPIKGDRLEELPWARYSIEAARELERRANLP